MKTHKWRLIPAARSEPREIEKGKAHFSGLFYGGFTPLLHLPLSARRLCCVRLKKPERLIYTLERKHLPPQGTRRPGGLTSAEKKDPEDF